MAEKWNVKESGSGYATRFLVRRSYMNQFEVQCVGASHHAEWWIPAEDLETPNNQIVGLIEVISSYGEA